MKFAIATSTNTPSDLETKLIIDSTAIYLQQNTYCFGDMTFSGLVNGLTSSMVGLGNVANTAPSDCPVSTLGLNFYGISNGSALFDAGLIQHKNRLKFAIATSTNTPSDLETKLIIDSTAIDWKTKYVLLWWYDFFRTGKWFNLFDGRLR